MNKKLNIILIILLLLNQFDLLSQTKTLGLLLNDSTQVYNGYTLFTPLKSKVTYLIDNNGNMVHSWNSNYVPGQYVMLLEDGSIMHSAFLQNNKMFKQGGIGGRIEKISWEGEVIWSFEHSSDTYCTHHDFDVLPNGNVLLLSYEVKTLNEASEAGRNLTGATYTEVWSEKVIEVQPNGSNGGTIVWEWHIWDHLIQDYSSSKSNYGVVSDHPELYNINFGDMKNDWLHMNSLKYNPIKDEIVLSLHATSEIIIIDHSTTTDQAKMHSGGKKGKGGDILYRWGNPLAYKMGSASDQKLFSQHDASWIPEGYPGSGNITIFNNGVKRPGGQYSSIEEIKPPLDKDGNYFRDNKSTFGPDSAEWKYTAQPPESFWGLNISGAKRLPNGNTIICQGPDGKLFEVTKDKKIVWFYINPVSNSIFTQGQTPTENMVFKINKYSPDFKGFKGKELISSGPIEKYTSEVISKSYDEKVSLYPNPAGDYIFIKSDKLIQSFELSNIYGERMPVSINENMIDISSLPTGIFFIIINQNKLKFIKGFNFR